MRFIAKPDRDSLHFAGIERPTRYLRNSRTCSGACGPSNAAMPEPSSVGRVRPVERSTAVEIVPPVVTSVTGAVAVTSLITRGVQSAGPPRAPSEHGSLDDPDLRPVQ